jgi:hypothetical protein
MKKAAHTPGPWKIQVFTNAILIESEGARARASSGHICEMPVGLGSGRRSRVANARLIAAAPKMFEVLNLLLDGADEKGRWINHQQRDVLIREAIAEAKGGAA